MTTAAPSAPPTPVPPNTVIYFPDPTLETAIRQALGKSTTGKLTAREMATLTTLSAPGRGISDLSGVEYLVNLTRLDLTSNRIGDLSPLAYLTNLTELSLSGNQITGHGLGLSWLAAGPDS